MKNEKIIYDSKKIRDFNSIFFLGIILLFWIIICGGTVILLTDIYFSAPSDFGLSAYKLFIFIPHSIMGIYIIDHFLWETNGKEKITLNNDDLTIIKYGKLIRVKYKLKINSIQNIYYDQEFFLVKQLREAFYLNGNLKIRTKFFSYRIGVDLDFETANDIIKQIKNTVPADIN